MTVARWRSTQHQRRRAVVVVGGSAVEIGEYGEYPPVIVPGEWEVELGEDVGDVFLDRAWADVEARGGWPRCAL
jgi:hypothetical protein